MSTFGTTVSAFNDWLNVTREKRAQGTKEVINETQMKSYIFGEMIRNRPEGDLFQPSQGKYWEFRIIGGEQGGTGWYTPGQERDPQRASVTYNGVAPYRFSEHSYPYTEADLRFNTQAPTEVQWLNFSYLMRNTLFTTHLNFIERAFWDMPHFGNMEAGALSGVASGLPGAAYSIPSLITEDGLVPPANGGTFTAIHGISPATYSWWRNPFATYDTADIEGTLFGAFDSLLTDLQFRTVPGYDQYHENDDLRKIKICTNKDGKTTFQRLLREANDHTRAGPQDASYGMPVFEGYPIVYIERLGDGTNGSALEQNPIGTYTSVPYPNGRPRFFVLNMKYLLPIFDSSNFFREPEPVNAGVRQRDAFAMFIVTWFNLVIRSRRRGGGIIRPSA